MNYRKYRTASRWIFIVPLLVALIAAGVYVALIHFQLIEAQFEWEYLAALGGVVAIAIFLSFWLFCISCSVKKRELASKMAAEQEKSMDVCARHSVEPIYIQTPQVAQNSNTAFCADCANGRTTHTIKVELDPEQMKTVAMIAIPTAAVTAGVAVAIASKKARRKKKIKRILRDLERSLGGGK